MTQNIQEELQVDVQNIKRAIKYLWTLMYAGDMLTKEEKLWFRKFIEEIKD